MWFLGQRCPSPHCFLLTEPVPSRGAKGLSCDMGVLPGAPTLGIAQTHPRRVPLIWLRAQSCILMGQCWGSQGRRCLFWLVGFSPPHPFQPALPCAPSLATTLLLIPEIKPLPSKFLSSSLGGLEG